MARELRLDDLYKMRLASDPQLSPDGTQVAYVQTSADRRSDSYHSSIQVCSTTGGKPKSFTQGPEDSSPRWSPDGGRIGFLRKGKEGAPQLWVMPADGGEARQITRAALGVAEFAWSMDGRRIAFTAFVSVDEAKEERAEASPIEVKELLYKLDAVGISKGLKPHLFVMGLNDDEARQLTRGDFSVSSPTWSPSGSEIAFISAMHPDRGLDFAFHLFVIGLEDEQVRQLTFGPTMALTPVWARTGDHILFAGRPEATLDTHTHVFSVNAGGGEPIDLITGFDRNVLAGIFGYPGARLHLGPDGESVFFSAQEGGCVHVFEVGRDGGSPTRVIGDDERVITGLAIGSAITFIASAYDTPGDLLVTQLDGSDERRLTRLNEELLANIDLIPYQRRNFTAPDGTPIEGWLIDGGGEQSRPLLLDIHGGPHFTWGPSFLDVDLHSQMLAAQGWAVLLLNPRGSDGYSQEFERALRGGWGVNDLNDFMSAVDTLITEGVADPDRLAVAGYSYGGYMTNWIVSQTDRFAAAVSGGSLSNLTSMYGTADIGAWMMNHEMQAEAYEKPDLYWELSPIAHVSNVSTPILILHGEADDRLPFGQAEEWFVALKRQRKPAELVVYPGASHFFRMQGRPSHRIDYSHRIVEWLTSYVNSG